MLSIAIPQLAIAQEADDEEVFELSPFTVDASEDTGYTATATLAGTRVRTDLKDLGAAISVYTAEFMDDTGATDAATLLSYTSNTEVGGYQGNFSGAGPDNNNGGRFMQSSERTDPQLNQRIRGLGRADLTRNLFLTDIPFDSYNTDRITVSRGPNSLLFGIGSPGGVIENSTKQAVQNSDFGELGLRFDNYNSWRTEFDYNKTIVEDRVALRVSLLNENQKYKQEPTFDDQERFYAALDVVLFENEGSDVLDATRFRTNYEQGEQTGSPVEIIPPTIAYHGWFEPIPANIEQFSGIAPTSRVVSPNEGGTWEFQTTYNPYKVNAEGGINTNTHPSWFRWIAIVFDEADAQEPNLGMGDGLQGYQGLLTWNSNLDTLGSTGLFGTPGAIDAFGPDATPDTPVNRHVEYHANSPYSEAYAIGFAPPTLQNTDVFDYRNQIYSGGIDRIKRNFDVKNFALEQSFFNNKLAVEIAYDKQHYETHQDFFFSGSGGTSTTGPYDIYVTIAEYLPDGRPHPNLGRPYTRVGRQETNFVERDRETFRVTAFGELDLSEKDGFLGWLGRHRFTGLYNDHTRDNHNIETREAWVNDDFNVRDALQAAHLRVGRGTTSTVVYVGDSMLGLQSLDDVRLNQIQISRPQPGDSYNVLYTDTSSATADRTLARGNTQIERFINNDDISQTNIEAKAFAWQSYFLKENIVGLYGYREDDTESFARASDEEVGFPRWDNDDLRRWNDGYTRLSSTPSLVESGDTTTWSVVARYPENFLGDLPAGMDIQLHYAESENFNPVGLRNNALAQPIGQPTGTTEEYGGQISFADNKFIIKVNWFETALNDVNAGISVNVGSEAYGRINSYRDAEITLERTFDNQLVTVGDRSDEAQAAFPIQDYDTFYETMLSIVPAEFKAITNPRQVDTDGDGLWDDLDWNTIPALRSTQDRVAEGFELEMIANPSPGWRILANISQQETIQSNTASVMAKVVEDFTAGMLSTRIGELRRDPGGTVQTRPIQEIWLSESVAEVRGATALDNTVSNEQREWRYTFVSTYRFMEGGLRGFSVGGAGRWETKAATGYVFQVEPESGVPIPDVNRPFFDDGLFSGDLWVSYSKMLTDKIDWRVQLNVRNAFGDNDDIPVKTNPDGQVAVIRIPNPRTIYLSNTFKF
jgi:outer membrane receptor protein involved in Fe transport